MMRSQVIQKKDCEDRCSVPWHVHVINLSYESCLSSSDWSFLFKENAIGLHIFLYGD